MPHKIAAFGMTEAITAATEMLFSTGATEIAFGYDGPQETPPGTELVLYVEATGRDGQVRRGQSDPTADYPLGMATAIQRLLESLGVRVTIMDAR
jgi:hypothetical protein